MKKHIYTDEEVNRAHKTNLAEFLEKRNEEVRKIGSHYYWMHDGETISISNNLWFNQYTQKGGEAIGFVKGFFKVGFAEAVGILLGETYAQIEEREHKICSSDIKTFKLPEKNERMNRVSSYLENVRGINHEVLNEFIKHGLIYEDKKYHGAVFVGTDRNGNPKHAHERGSSKESKFKMTVRGSEPEFSFHWNGSDGEIYLFEAPIDMLSYITLFSKDWKKHSYAAACSVSDKVLFQCMKDNPEINVVHICFDNDTAGQKAAERIIGKLSRYDVAADIIKPDFKDWNEDLTTPDGMKPIGRGMMID